MVRWSFTNLKSRWWVCVPVFAGIYVSMCCLVKDISIITVPRLGKPLTARGNSGTCTMIKRLKAVWTSVICFLW